MNNQISDTGSGEPQVYWFQIIILSLVY